MKPHSILLVLVLVPVVSAKLPHDLAAKIPPCAQQCVQSFLNVNYNEDKHGSLKQLCLQNGASGYTLGEGAMQCLTAERATGYCSDSDASEEVVYGAYSMCNNVKGAVLPTHGVITATLAVAPTGGAMTFPPIEPDPSSTASDHTTSHTSHTTLQTTTSSEYLSTAESTTVLPTSTPPPLIASHSSALPPKKIAGIVTGSIGGLAALIGLFFLARHIIRRHRKRNSDSWAYKDSHNRSSSSDIPNPIYDEMHTVPLPKQAYTRESYRSSAIGLALPVSAKASPRPTLPVPPIATSRPVSRLLPEKPDLPPIPPEQQTAVASSPTIRAVPFEPPTLQVQSATPTTIHAAPSTPPTSYTPPAIIASPPPVRTPNRAVPPLQLRIPKRSDSKPSAFAPPQHIIDRQSVATEFEEDGQDSSISGVNRLLSPAGETWCPPSAGGFNSAYISDGHGNWKIKPSNLAESPALPDEIPQRPNMSTQTSSSDTLPQEYRQSPQSTSSSQFHRATEALALSNRSISSAVPPTPDPSHTNVRLSRATMPSPLFNQSRPSPRSVSQPTLQHVPIPAPTQTPRSVSANQRQSHAPSQQTLSPVAESPLRPALRHNQPNFVVQPPAHHHYNPLIPHSSDDRASLPSHTRHQPPPSNIRHNYPLNPSRRAGPGGNPHGTPYPDNRYPAVSQQQRLANQRPYQNPHPYPYPPQQQRQLQPQEPQRQPQPRQTPYPEDPRSLWEKRQGAKASPITINSPFGSGDPRWQRHGQDTTKIPWRDQ